MGKYSIRCLVQTNRIKSQPKYTFMSETSRTNEDLPCVDTARLLAKSTLFPARITVLDLSRSAFSNAISSVLAFEKLALSTTEYTTTKASGGFVLSISCK